jgi:hypothetical protein
MIKCGIVRPISFPIVLEWRLERYVMYTLLVASNLALILQLPTHHAQDNSMASRAMDLRVATATSRATATRFRIVLRALQFTRLLCCSLVRSY